jgi:hypothetical protein
MKTETAGSPQPAEVLIPEARRHQRTRYRRRGAAVVIVALVVAALILSAVLLVRGPAAGGKAQSDPKPVAAATAAASGVVSFRQLLCYAAPYDGPAGASAGSPAKTAPTSTEAVPLCSAASFLSQGKLNVTPASEGDGGPQGYSSNFTPVDQQYASVPSTNVHSPGYASRNVLLPGFKGACDGDTQIRCVLGPVEMSSRAIAKATAMQNKTGQWVVDYTTTAAGSALWDKVTRESFHAFLGIELNGVVYSAPIIQPTQTSFSSFDGRGEISGSLTKAAAVRLAKALSAHQG